MEQNKKIEFELSKLVLSTYNNIALWNNNDYDSDKQKGDALKIVSQALVQNILEELIKELDVKTNTEISRGEVKVGDLQAIKDSESFDKLDDRDIIDKIFGN